jgi:hypothetical protein
VDRREILKRISENRPNGVPQMFKSGVLSLESTYTVIFNYITRYYCYDSETQNLNCDIVRDIELCSPSVKRCFGGTYHIQLQGGNSAKQETSVQLNLASLLLHASFLLGRFSTLKMEVICSSQTPKLHSAISQKMVTFITTAFRTSHPTNSGYVCWMWAGRSLEGKPFR